MRVPSLGILVVLALAGCVGSTAEVGPLEVAAESALLWSASYPRLVILVEHVEGVAPTPSVLDDLVRTLKDVTEKREIAVVGPTPIPGLRAEPDRVWTRSELSELHTSHHGDEWHSPLRDGAAFLHVHYLDGSYDTPQADHALGVAIGVDLYVFPRSFRSSLYLDIPGSVEVERSVLVHEAGHALGLVGCGVPMVRPHQADGCHSANEDSVMYATVDASLPNMLAARAFPGWITAEFDEDDLADLAAFRALDPAR